MKVPKQARRQAKRLLRLCQTDGVLNVNRLRDVVTHILEIRPRGYLPILVHLHRLVQLDEEQRSVLIESALPLEEPVRASIQTSLQRRYGPSLLFRFAEQPGLIAGVRVRVGSDVYDSSILARLNTIERTFDSE